MAKNCVFRKKGGVAGQGLVTEDRPLRSRPSHGVRGKGFVEGRGLTFQPFPLGWREGGRGGTSQAFPWKGKGDRRRRWMRLIKIKRRKKFRCTRWGAKPRPRTGWGSPAGSPRFVFCLQKTKPSPPRSYGCSAHFAEKRKFKDFGLKSFDLTGEKLRPAIREGFPERTA